jgi:hypothetical protein
MSCPETRREPWYRILYVQVLIGVGLGITVPEQDVVGCPL